MVSRVSAAARSIGLPRLHRGGSSASIAARRSSGSDRSDSSERASASAVSTPHPPAVVSTATFGPRGSGWVAKVAAASNASSTVVARLTPACRHMPAKIRSSVASAPVCDAAARRPPGVAPPRTNTSGCSPRRAPQGVEERAAVAHAFEVREAHVGGGVGGEELEIVGDLDHRGVARGHRAADADSGAEREVLERRHDVAGLAGDADAARRVGTAPPSARRATTAWTRCPGRSALRAGRPPPRRRRPARVRLGGRRRPPRRSRPSSRTRHALPCARSRARGRH